MSAAAEVQALHALAERLGVQRSYIDLAGRRQRASTAALLQITAALDGSFDALRQAPDALRRRLDADRRRVVEPVLASFGRAAPRLPLQLAAPTATPRVLVQSECDQEFRELQPVRLLSTARGSQLLLPPLPLGYHRLRLQIGAAMHETLLVRAPQRLSPMPPDGLGMFLPLHALRHDDDLGVGSYGGLARLAQWCGEHGGRVLSTLPLLATNLDEPFEYSPYSPLSRCFWNEVFLDVAAAPGLTDCDQARRALAAIEAPAAALRRQPLVDYRAAVAMVRSVLQPLAQWTAAAATPIGESFRSFRGDAEIERYARFRAVLAARGEPWQSWPEPMRRGDLPDGSFDAELATYHAYTQWLAGRQLDAARADADAAGVSLYLDLPLGVHPAGFDTFRHQGLFVAGAAAGAPPDPLFSKGQNWGFPPLHPERQRQQGYGHMIAVLRHHLRCARILRLDHVMGLHRLYYIANGMPATAGLYVRYPAEEMFAIVCLEAARAGCHVVGEDLGTVPPIVRKRMDRHGLSRLHVLQHSIAPQHQPPVLPAPKGSVASLNTHDMPTFAGFLAGGDLRDQVQMGLLDDQGLAAATAERERNIAALIAHLQQRGLVGDSPGPQQVMRGAQLLLAAGDSELLLLNLEDLWLEPLPQNVPGTWRERPNWLRRAAVSFASMRQMTEVDEVLAALILARHNRRPR